MLLDINHAISTCKELLASCGVAFVLMPHFKNTGVQGATFWLNNKDKAVLMISLREISSDKFWFSLFHEIGHILLHNKREIFIENGYNTPKLQQQESEANHFAQDYLIPPKDFENFIMSGKTDKVDIKAFAESLSIKPSIVIGRMLHEKVLSYTHPLRQEIDKYKFK